MQVTVEPFNFLFLPANIHYFSLFVDGHLSKAFDALRDLRDTRLALLCLICKLSDVSVNHLRSSYIVLSKQESAIKCTFLVSTKFSFINTTEIVLKLYLFPLQIEVACFVIKLAIIIANEPSERRREDGRWPL